MEAASTGRLTMAVVDAVRPHPGLLATGLRGAATQHTRKAPMTRRAVCHSPSTPAAAGAMHTSRFLIRCLGRIPRTMWPKVERRPVRGRSCSVAVLGPDGGSSAGTPLYPRHGATADMVMKSRAHHDWK